MYFKDNLKTLRRIKRITQEKLAEEISITRRMVQSYEDGRAEPSIETLLKFSRYFGVRVDDILKMDLSEHIINWVR